MLSPAADAVPPAGPSGAQQQGPGPREVPRAEKAWRFATADLRSWPDFVIVGTQRGGTTSLHYWLTTHPEVTPAVRKEIHYFDAHYAKGARWYRSHFPLPRRGQITGEASPYMLFHPLAPARAAKHLPETTRFIVLLREPVQRTVSHYWYMRRRKGFETEPLERAIALEPERLAGETEKVMRGEISLAHSGYSYVARSEYVGQLQAWFDAVGRDRILIVESELLYNQPSVTAGIVEWLGLGPHDHDYPVANQSERLDVESPELLAQLHDHFVPYNQKLFDLLGHELWTDQPKA